MRVAENKVSSFLTTNIIENNIVKGMSLAEYPPVSISRRQHRQIFRRHLGTLMEKNKMTVKPVNGILFPDKNKDFYSTLLSFLKAYILGTAPSMSRVLSEHPPMTSSLLWLVAHFMSAVLRTAGAPIFLNNPISGVLILVAVCVSADGAGTAIAGTALMGMTVAAATAILLFNEKEEGITTGATTFNGFLTGLLLTDYYGLKERPWLIVPIIVASFMSVLVKNGLDYTLRQVELPSLNTPSIILVAVFNSCIGTVVDVPPTPDQLDWIQVLQGVVRTSGQIYVSPSILSSCLIYLALVIYSPILAMLGIAGAAIGTLLGAGYSSDIKTVYSGAWGTNSMLTAMALGSVFCNFSIHSACSATAGAIFATTLYGALIRVPGIPVLAFPFILSTWLLIGSVRRQERSQSPEFPPGLGISYLP